MEVFHMFLKAPLTLIALVVVGCFTPYGGNSAAKASSPPDFGPATYPMTRAEFFERINSKLVASCDASREQYNLGRDKCLQLIAQRTTFCAKSVPIASTIVGKAQFKTYGREYLGCAKPYFFCNGIEVKTLGVAMGQCR
jgi:hypothetical protein